MQHMQAASRLALAEAVERLDAHLDSAPDADAGALGDELFAAADLLAGEPVLRRHLADPATDPADRVRLLTSVVGGALGAAAMGILEGLVGARWSRPRDLVDAAERLGQLAWLSVAQRQGVIEEVEDELFRAGRLVDRESHLRTLLGDLTVPADRRVGLLGSVLSGKVHPVTDRLLARAVQAGHGVPLDRAAESLAELAAARRERFVAKVRTPVELTDAQQQRLAISLSRIYRRDMSLQVELDPALLGGLVVMVADEVIDGSVAGRLAAAQQHLPR
jgi:F-type H+-transporting ATPase subunit delta